MCCLPVFEGEAPGVKLAVCEADCVLLPDAVEDGLTAEVGLLVPVDVPVSVALGVGGGVALLDSDVLPVLEGEAPSVKLVVGEADCLLLSDRVEVGVTEAVELLLPVGVAVRVGLDVGRGGTLLDSDVLPMFDGEDPGAKMGDAVCVVRLDSVEVGVVEVGSGRSCLRGAGRGHRRATAGQRRAASVGGRGARRQAGILLGGCVCQPTAAVAVDREPCFVRPTNWVGRLLAYAPARLFGRDAHQGQKLYAV